MKLDDSEIIGQWSGGIGADGSFSGSVTVPAGTAKGAHWLRILAPNPATSLKAGFTVTSGSDAATTGGSGASTSASATPVPTASGAPASASNSAGAKAEITASQVQPGGTLHFKVTKFPAGETVTIKLDDDGILGQWQADSAGSYEGDVAIPADTTAGAHWLRFLAPNPPTTLKVEFTVTEPGTTADSGSGLTSATAAPETVPNAALATSVESSVSVATIAWSATAAAIGGAAGAAGTTVFVLRRRPQHAAGS